MTRPYITFCLVTLLIFISGGKLTLKISGKYLQKISCYSTECQYMARGFPCGQIGSHDHRQHRLTSMLSVIINSCLYLTYVPTSFREHLSDYKRKWAMASFSKTMQQFTHTKKINKFRTFKIYQC
jgi:hypothetical protein